ncbi:MAG: hypothetical protein ACRC7C_02610, partial [Beijerinckiaceae bacterium]
LALSGFPMAPWFSRIAGGVFSFDGEIINAASPGRGEVPADLHGLLWDRPFRIERCDATCCVLVAEVAAVPDQPYAFEARLTYALAGDRFSMALDVVNRGRRLPFGLGLHPFFRRTPGFRLSFAADGYLATDETAMPVRAAPLSEMPALAGAAGVDALVGLNHGFFGWRGPARLAWGDLGIAAKMTARASSPMLLHIYAPAHEPLICLEPVTNAPDVIHRRAFAPFADMTPLDVGEVASVSLAVDFSFLDPAQSAAFV